MIVFTCAGCGAALTAPLARVALPVHAHQQYGHELLPPLMEPGTCAIDPEPFCGPADAVVIAPGDARGTALIPGRYGGYCLGLTGCDGPNLACERCARPVGTRVDDCSLWQAVRLRPDAVRAVPGGAPDPPVLEWGELRRARPAVPPVEDPGLWSPLWEASAAAALPRLLALSGGARPRVPGGLLATVFGRPLDALLPPGPARGELALAGPGLPPAGGAIALVPRHPQTGGAWPSGTGRDVPLDAGVWLHLAFHRPRPPDTVLPAEVRRDDPRPRVPYAPFQPDWHLFRDALARLPDTGEPWLRAVRDRFAARPHGPPF
ncbi:hypothetical protein [Actinomadura bangladeshensis]|uniref:Uncharacterized protein n=1 Tax=Actinomadura bangladeshensis TaxID=453573 RepID=A0A4R4MZW8_9ACTN|nr:hypothetical protein [Actinomadura bangladeshensis]TDC01921.1 hypothetical protein E1284_39825 [Actinomadura bangladeshensis]